MIRMLSAKWSGLLRFKPGDFDGLLTAFRGAGFAARVSRFELKYRNGLPPGSRRFKSVQGELLNSFEKKEKMLGCSPFQSMIVLISCPKFENE